MVQPKVLPADAGDGEGTGARLISGDQAQAGREPELCKLSASEPKSWAHRVSGLTCSHSSQA